MTRAVFIAIVMYMTLLSCNGQKKDEVNKSSKNLPQTNIKVNKEYDKKGNLIKYDSTYSYYYSNIAGKDGLKDSIFSSFKDRFNKEYYFSKRPYFNDFFFQDSLLDYDFYKKDFFYKRYLGNMLRMERLFHEMDSLKNDFYKDQFPKSKSTNKK